MSDRSGFGDTVKIVVLVAVLFAAGVVVFKFYRPGGSPGTGGGVSGGVTELTANSFKAAVASGVHVVDFWADWCQPCKMLTPMYNKLSGTFAGKVSFHKLDVDKYGDLATQFGIEGIPTIIFFKDGKEINRIVGLPTEGALTQAVANAAQ